VGYRYLADKKIAKGDLVYIEGKIKNRKYKDKDGNEKYFTEILSEKINLLGHPKSASEYSGSTGSYNSQDNSDTNTETTTTKATDTPEDDLPF
jgi:single-strand DNA-binding protein